MPRIIIAFDVDGTPRPGEPAAGGRRLAAPSPLWRRAASSSAWPPASRRLTWPVSARGMGLRDAAVMGENGCVLALGPSFPSPVVTWPLSEGQRGQLAGGARPAGHRLRRRAVLPAQPGLRHRLPGFPTPASPRTTSTFWPRAWTTPNSPSTNTWTASTASPAAGPTKPGRYGNWRRRWRPTPWSPSATVSTTSAHVRRRQPLPLPRRQPAGPSRRHRLPSRRSPRRWSISRRR